VEGYVGVMSHGLRKLVDILHSPGNDGVLIDETGGPASLRRGKGDRIRHLLQGGAAVGPRGSRAGCGQGKDCDQSQDERQGRGQGPQKPYAVRPDAPVLMASNPTGSRANWHVFSVS